MGRNKDRSQKKITSFFKKPKPKKKKKVKKTEDNPNTEPYLCCEYKDYFNEYNNSDDDKDEESHMEDDDYGITTQDGQWVAGKKIMEDAGCVCTIKQGDKCRCNSFDWAYRNDGADFDSKISKYKRPDVQPLSFYKKNGVEFCILETKYVMVDGFSNIYAFGVTKDGNSVFCEIYGFKPYFYLSTKDYLDEFEIQTLKSKLLELLRIGKKVEYIDIKKINNKISTHGFKKHCEPNLYKIITKEPGAVSMLRKKILDKNELASVGISFKRVYESNIDFVLRFGTDVEFGGTQWVRAAFIDCGIRGLNSHTKNKGRCQIEFTVNYTKLIPVPKIVIPPTRTLSFDIECISYSGKFPSASVDPTFQICSVLDDTFDNSSRSVVYTLGTCNKISGSDVYCFSEEKHLFIAFRDLIRKYQPNIITGYNIDKFDNPYLFDRAQKISIKDEYSKYTLVNRKLSRRDRSHIASIRSHVFESKAYGKMKSNMHVCSGIITMDLFRIISREMKLSSYKLNNISKVILGDQKDDVHHTEISRLFNRDREGRTIVAEYCEKDARLPIEIMKTRKIVTNLYMLSFVTRVSLRTLIEKGQTAKVKALLLTELKKRNMILPTLTDAEKRQQQRSYKGAYVENPLCGYYGSAADQIDMSKFIKSKLKQMRLDSKRKSFKKMNITFKRPITCLDFKSLYPTIVIAHNLCYTTQTTLEEIRRNGWVEDVDYYKTPTPTPHYFVSAKIRKGVLPTILEYLLNERDKVKDQMKIEKDPLIKSILDGKQLGLKICANSVYGFTGSMFYPNRDISESVTAYGQVYIKMAKKIIETQYTIANGYNMDAVAVYGYVLLFVFCQTISEILIR
jgi:DNA polymerase delta subunit 1